MGAEVGHDEPHAREQFPVVALDLRRHPAAGLVPSAGLVREVVIPDDRLVGRTAYRPRQQRFDLALQQRIGRKADRVEAAFAFHVLVRFQARKRRVAPEEAADVQVAVAGDDRLQHRTPAVRAGHVAVAELAADPLITEPICLRDRCELCLKACIMDCVTLRDDPSVTDYRSAGELDRTRIFLDTPARTDPTLCRRRRDNRPDSPIRGDCLRICPVPAPPRHLTERLRQLVDDHGWPEA